MECQACGGWSYNDQCDTPGCECACHGYEAAPAQPGDVLVYTDSKGQETRQLVAEASVRVVNKSLHCGCGSCTEDVCEVTVRVFSEESELVIAKGGGCLRVLPVEDFSDTWGWPPEDHKLLRDGQVIWEPPCVEGSKST